MDTFICGNCHLTFHDINLFVTHKNAGCEATEVVIHSPEVTEIQTLHVIEGNLDEEPGKEDMCLVEVNQQEPVSELRLIPVESDQTDGSELQVIISQPEPPPPAKPTGRRRGRPRKGEEKNPKPAPKPQKEETRALPELGPDGKLHCARCKKSFSKQRHFNTHRCLATSDYVDITQHDVMSEDEASEEEDRLEDKSVEFRVGNRRGRPPKNRSQSTAMPSGGEASGPTPPGGGALGETETSGGHEEKAGDDVGGGSGLQGRVRRGKPGRPREADASDASLLVTDPAISKSATVASRENIPNLPVFADEEEKLAFEESLNVDLCQVDSMFKTHVIEQNVNQNAPPPASRTSSELSIFSCYVCDKVFKTISHMRLHCLTHTDLKPFKCTKCDYASNSKGNLYTHMRKHTGQFYSCGMCNFRTVNKSHLVEHEATHSKQRHKCSICRKDYNTVKSLINHVRKYHSHSKAGREYLCQFQGKKNQRQAMLHQCHICLRKFKKKIDRDRHLFVHNIRNLPNVHICELCDYTASRRTYLEKHFKKHSVVYVCFQCTAKFPSSVFLNQHLDRAHGCPDMDDRWVDLFQQCIEVSLFLPESDNAIEDMNSEASSGLDNVQRVSVPMQPQMTVIVPGKDSKWTTETSTNSDIPIAPESAVEAQSKDLGSLDKEQSRDRLEPCQGQEKPQGQAEGECQGESKGSAEHGDPGGSKDQSTSELRQSETSEAKDGEDVAEDDPEELLTEEAAELENVKDYNIYQRLGYCNMNMEIFHKLRQTYGNEECEFCGRLFFSKADFEPHQRTHTGDKPFACGQCSYRAVTKDNLKRHTEKEHEKVTYVCQECNHVASSRTQLWHHQQKHKRPNIECTTCNLSFPSAKRLRIHVSIKHPAWDRSVIQKMITASRKTQGKFGRKAFKCPYCPKTFLRASSDLQKHIWIHEGIKPFKCSLCSHACRSKNNLMSHMLRHSAEKPFLCGECGKAYKSKTALRWHVRTHKDGKMFRCTKCNYEAIQHSHLKRHMQTHNVVKRFVCQHCDYSANTIGYMKIHYTRNHKGLKYTYTQAPPKQMEADTKVYRCLSCDYLFGNLSDMKRHLKVRHHVRVEDIRALETLEAQNVATQSVTNEVTEQVPQPQIQVVQEVEPSEKTAEENDASTALQALQYSVPGTHLDEGTAANILQQIIDMSQQGAFSGQQQITVQSEDGQNLVVNPNTIIVQQNGEEYVLSGDGSDAPQQYVIQYVTQAQGQEEDLVTSDMTEVGTTEVVSEDQTLIDGQVVQFESPAEITEEEAPSEAIEVIMASEEDPMPTFIEGETIQVCSQEIAIQHYHGEQQAVEVDGQPQQQVEARVPSTAGEEQMEVQLVTDV